jgi:hypothetical protein
MKQAGIRHFSDFLTKLGVQKGSVEIEARQVRALPATIRGHARTAQHRHGGIARLKNLDGPQSWQGAQCMLLTRVREIIVAAPHGRALRFPMPSRSIESSAEFVFPIRRGKPILITSRPPACDGTSRYIRCGHHVAGARYAQHGRVHDHGVCRPSLHRDLMALRASFAGVSLREAGSVQSCHSEEWIELEYAAKMRFGRIVIRQELEKLGPLAQRLEQRTHNPLVVGSNPTGPTNQPPIVSGR